MSVFVEDREMILMLLGILIMLYQVNCVQFSKYSLFTTHKYAIKHTYKTHPYVCMYIFYHVI